MGKPTTSELRQALDRAIHMRESGADPDHLAKSLLNLHFRLQKLERVMELSKRYLHAGEDAYEHKRLVKAIEEAERAGADPGSDDGLPIIGRGVVT